MTRRAFRMAGVVVGLLVLGPAARAEEVPSTPPANLIPNGDFREGEVGGLPDGWTLKAARPSLAPVFELVQTDEGHLLLGTGGGNPDCVGYVRTAVPIALGKTYRFRVLFRVSGDLNPHESLLFQCFGPGARNGIFELVRLEGGWVEGEAKIHYPGQGSGEAEVRILFRLSGDGKVWVKSISLEETEDPLVKFLRDVGRGATRKGGEWIRRLKDQLSKD